jgi:hypothetical protein
MTIPAPLPDPFLWVADLPGQAADLQWTGGRFHWNPQSGKKFLGTWGFGSAVNLAKPFSGAPEIMFFCRSGN